jgi:hypothetical protein
MVTVDAMEVLIKYCTNSFLKLINSFDRKLIDSLLLLNEPITFQNRLTNRKRTGSKKKFEFVWGNEFMQYFINTSIASTVIDLMFLFKSLYSLQAWYRSFWYVGNLKVFSEI